ncbi:hypothetical protein LX36DRAFT_499088 [Colletotrichum falcatum]|nr:hypothetical protein LX36DRAFT_499088 [Colletotrichum falcatum]
MVMMVMMMMMRTWPSPRCSLCRYIAQVYSYSRKHALLQSSSPQQSVIYTHIHPRKQRQPLVPEQGRGRETDSPQRRPSTSQPPSISHPSVPSISFHRGLGGDLFIHNQLVLLGRSVFCNKLPFFHTRSRATRATLCPCLFTLFTWLVFSFFFFSLSFLSPSSFFSLCSYNIGCLSLLDLFLFGPQPNKADIHAPSLIDRLISTYTQKKKREKKKPLFTLPTFPYSHLPFTPR